ncbi:MAG: hypothetical protein L6Q84_07810 [Polyangiaceae bacterium]|nr:hypothetical protein [Polyangiaceae bacterium]
MMSNQDQIERLQGLLDRVQKNAARPRVAAAVAAAPVAEPAPEPAEEEELVAMDEAEVIPPEPVVAEAEVLEETSMVRAIAESEVSVEMGEASIEDLDLLEDEIVDITEAAPEPAGTEAEEEPPASSRRAIAGSMGEALAEAVDSVGMDEGREIPLKTPPPESGPQAAPPPQGLAAPPVPDLHELREADIVSGTQPTAAQLGATVELEPAAEGELELGEPVTEAPPVHLVREEAPVAAAAVAAVEPVQPAASVEPEVVRRPAAATAPAGAFVSAAKGFHPQSFLELLDASLALGRD